MQARASSRIELILRAHMRAARRAFPAPLLASHQMRSVRPDPPPFPPPPHQVEFPPEYPSHLPPTARIVGGVADEAERAHIVAALACEYFERSAGESVVHLWCEWLRDEWIALLE